MVERGLAGAAAAQLGGRQRPKHLFLEGIGIRLRLDCGRDGQCGMVSEDVLLQAHQLARGVDAGDPADPHSRHAHVVAGPEPGGVAEDSGHGDRVAALGA